MTCFLVSHVYLNHCIYVFLLAVIKQDSMDLLVHCLFLAHRGNPVFFYGNVINCVVYKSRCTRKLASAYHDNFQAPSGTVYIFCRTLSSSLAFCSCLHLNSSVALQRMQWLSSCTIVRKQSLSRHARESRILRPQMDWRYHVEQNFVYLSRILIGCYFQYTNHTSFPYVKIKGTSHLLTFLSTTTLFLRPN